ncbi:MAG TPA: hypothetical protein V6C58_21640 [Allocoleopsis sp.]
MSRNCELKPCISMLSENINNLLTKNVSCNLTLIKRKINKFALEIFDIYSGQIMNKIEF